MKRILRLRGKGLFHVDYGYCIVVFFVAHFSRGEGVEVRKIGDGTP